MRRAGLLIPLKVNGDLRPVWLTPSEIRALRIASSNDIARKPKVQLPVWHGLRAKGFIAEGYPYHLTQAGAEVLAYVGQHDLITTEEGD